MCSYGTAQHSTWGMVGPKYAQSENANNNCSHCRHPITIDVAIVSYFGKTDMPERWRPPPYASHNITQCMHRLHTDVQFSNTNTSHVVYRQMLERRNNNNNNKLYSQRLSMVKFSHRAKAYRIEADYENSERERKNKKQ